jgi:dinuclear metal center YbgI/SA1388 family protein
MILRDIVSYLDTEVPLSFQESYDNSGLQVGEPEKEITSALLTLDVTEEVLAEAIEAGCNLIISHHPLIFSGIKKVTGKYFTDRIIIAAIKNDIAIYSSHTNLDVHSSGVSIKMAEKLGLKNIKVLSPLRNRLLKLVTFVPGTHIDNVRNAVFEAGAGSIGNYDNCGFTIDGKGSFRAGDATSPYVGEKGLIHFENEVRFETVLFTHDRERVVKALIAAHPYEEAAYDLYPLENNNTKTGLGAIGDLVPGMDEPGFLKLVSTIFDARGIRFSKMRNRVVGKVALCGGSGSSLLNDAISEGADLFLTADVKYHTFFEAENRILLVDTGHFESEKFATEILYDLIIKKFPKFAVRFSGTNRNPINYL